MQHINIFEEDGQCDGHDETFDDDDDDHHHDNSIFSCSRPKRLDE